MVEKGVCSAAGGRHDGPGSTSEDRNRDRRSRRRGLLDALAGLYRTRQGIFRLRRFDARSCVPPVERCAGSAAHRRLARFGLVDGPCRPDTRYRQGLAHRHRPDRNAGSSLCVARQACHQAVARAQGQDDLDRRSEGYHADLSGADGGAKRIESRRLRYRLRGRDLGPILGAAIRCGRCGNPAAAVQFLCRVGRVHESRPDHRLC